ncbi:hypothetical protein FNF29_00578 [Cafeteria roenbergensis]|uniref:SAP domain-containing protein n=1 Tax=Cafeteria roenbergensis TaxID=33653 RepID=A0A5A8CW02_CAFRO|nr:hypothetical protein FNF29_00578 [Cafeteria roenbergensis]|eukprot:KAA0157226.1 hypothetical protein FNF29_00578 [Cafeteria roenbergensis]
MGAELSSLAEEAAAAPDAATDQAASSPSSGRLEAARPPPADGDTAACHSTVPSGSTSSAAAEDLPEPHCEARAAAAAARDDPWHVQLPPPPERGILIREPRAKGCRASKGPAPRVRWGFVSARQYKRAVWGQGVPSRGAWPLALESTVIVPPEALADKSLAEIAAAAAAAAAAGVDLTEGTGAKDSEGSDAALPSEVRLFGADGMASPYLRPMTPVMGGGGLGALDAMPSLDLSGALDDASPSDDAEESEGQAGPFRAAYVGALRHASESKSPTAALGGRAPGKLRPRADSHDGAGASPPVASGAPPPRQRPKGKSKRGKGKRGKSKKAAAGAAAEDAASGRAAHGDADADADADTDAAGPSAASGAGPARAVNPAAALAALRPGEALLGSVDEFEARRASELARRNADLPPQDRAKGPLETRQQSHRRGGGNPLFNRLEAASRRDLLRREVGCRPDGARLIAEANRAAEIELAELRHSRANSGCNCRPAAELYKSMNAKKLRAELEARSLSTHGSKAEMLARIKEATAKEPLCGAGHGPGACPCAEAGVPCNYDVCKCDCDECSNPSGRDEYDGRAVRAHMKRVIKLFRQSNGLDCSPGDDPTDSEAESSFRDDGDGDSTTGSSSPLPGGAESPTPAKRKAKHARSRKQRTRSKSIA